MAVFALTDAYISINGVVLSDHGNQVSVTDSREKLDFTAFGATSKVSGKGLGDASVSITFFQDFAAAKVHATLSPLISSTTPVAVEVRATSAARSATNPAYLISALLFDYQMVDGGVGQPSTVNVDLSNASQTGVTYPVA